MSSISERLLCSETLFEKEVAEEQVSEFEDESLLLLKVSLQEESLLSISFSILLGVSPE